MSKDSPLKSKIFHMLGTGGEINPKKHKINLRYFSSVSSKTSSRSVLDSDLNAFVKSTEDVRDVEEHRRDNNLLRKRLKTNGIGFVSYQLYFGRI